MANQTPTQNSPFKAVAPVRIFEQAAEQIQGLINEGVIKPGEKLPPEHKLSQQLNVSRSSIREALRMLETEGLVEIKRGLGAFVSMPLSKEQHQDRKYIADWLQQREETIEQLLQVRESIEGLTAMLAASRASQSELEQIRVLVEKQSEQIKAIIFSGKEDYNVLAKLDAEFHLAISAMSGNDIANEIINHIVPAFNESNKAVLYVSKRMLKMEQEHLDILHALESRDPSKAEQVIRLHLSRVRDEILTLISEKKILSE
jgi:GntR family transcriptional regulator, transcriptional repressor for pyruvate dehydrogenase complex